jgi:hypothetical protein
MNTNLFNYATKELSQDAFICWLVANYDTEELKEESYRFLNLLMASNFLVGEIKIMTIKQQVNKIDIVIDFWTSAVKEPSSHYTLVIEDKTNSSAHTNQLVKYNEIIDKWNINEKGYQNRTRKVFFKSNVLTEEDKLEIEKANKNTEIRWNKIDLDDLYHGFFMEEKQSESEILNAYRAYFNKRYNDIKNVPTSAPANWNFYNFKNFFEAFFNEEYKDKYEFSSCSSKIYQGKFLSFSILFPLINEYEFHAVLEIAVKDELESYLHPGFHYLFKEGDELKEGWAWSLKEIKDDNDFIRKSTKRLENLREFVSENGNDIFHPKRTSRLFAKFSKKPIICYKSKSLDELKAAIKIWLDAFYSLLSKYKKHIENNKLN